MFGPDTGWHTKKHNLNTLYKKLCRNFSEHTIQITLANDELSWLIGNLTSSQSAMKAAGNDKRWVKPEAVITV